MTYNIRYDNAQDGPNAWPHRGGRVAALLRMRGAERVCIQEGLTHQVADLRERLRWDAFGVGRDDGEHQGEQVAILHDPKRLKRLRGGHFWLSPTPEKPGLGWDAACNRMATWAEFRDRNGRRFLVCNTHLDHEGPVARREGIRLLSTKLRALAGTLPILLAGDFNAEEDTEPMRLLMHSGLQDTRSRSEIPAYGPVRTFSGFSVHGAMVGGRIDYVFVSPGVTVRQHWTICDFDDAMRFPSDHLPVQVEVVLPKQR